MNGLDQNKRTAKSIKDYTGGAPLTSDKQKGKTMNKHRKTSPTKAPEPIYLCQYKDGYLDCAAQIYERHSDKLITVEYLPYLSMMTWVKFGIKPSLEPVDVEATDTLNLDEIKDEYKFHYSWVTVARDFAKSEKHYEKTEGKTGK